MLDGVRVVELGSGIAPAYCAKLLADAGAEVCRVEPAEGDPLRRWAAGVAVPDGEDGALFRFLHTSKRAVVGELDDDHVRSLLAAADIVVDGLAPGLVAALGLRGARPSLVVVSLSPFGQDGPWRDRPATELTLQAMCGSANRRGETDGPPLAAAGQLGEWVSASYGAAAAMAFHRGVLAGGSGAHIDLSMLECMIVTMQVFLPVAHAFRGGARPAEPVRTTNVPGVEPCADGFVGLTTITAQQLQDLFAMVGRPDLADDPDLRTAEGRLARRDEIRAAIRAWTGPHRAEEIIELASAFRIPAAPIGNGRSVTTFDHFIERGVFVENPHGFTQPRVPYRISGAGSRPLTPVPALGADGGAPPAWPARAGQVLPDGRPGRSADQPLAGLRVLDFTAFLAGPAVTHLLAALGAEVIKVESTVRPDGMRFTSNRPHEERFWEWSAIFASVNQNKRAVTIDLATAEGVGLALDLVRASDVVIENFSPRVMEQFGLGWDAVQAANPRALMVRMPAFGLDGPWRDRTGFAMTVEQVSGLAWITGFAHGPPVTPGGVCDLLAAMHAAVALLAALAHRDGTGRGALVEVPLVEAALNAAAEQIVEASAYGTLLGRDGNRGPRAAPQGIYPAAGHERWIALAVETDEQWAHLIELSGDDGLRDGALRTAAGRRRAAGALDDQLAGWTSGHDADELAERLVGAGIPAAAVVAAIDALDIPHVAGRGFPEAVDHPVVGRQSYPSLPFRLLGEPRRWYRRAAPTLGQDNREVLTGILGLTDEQVDRLEAQGTIGTVLRR